MRKYAVIALVIAIGLAVMGQTYGVRRLHVHDLDYGIGTRTIAGRLATTVTGHKFTPVNVLAFGVKGDTLTDDADSLQAVIDMIVAAGEGDIYVPPGSYRVSKTLTIRPNESAWSSHNIIFDFSAAELVADTTLNGPVIKIGDNTANTHNVTICGGVIRYAGSARNYDVEATGITIERGYSCEIDGLTVYGAYKGVELIASNGGCVYNRVRLDKIWDCVYGIYLENTDTGWVNDNTFDGGSIYYSSSVAGYGLSSAAAVYAQKDAAATYAMVGNRFHNLSLEANDGVIPDANLAKAMRLKAWDTNVFGCRFEGFDGSADTIQYILLDSGTWGYHFVGGTELTRAAFNRPRIVSTLHTERTHALAGSAEYLPYGGPILELHGRGGYGTGYPMVSVIRSTTDTCFAVNGAGAWAKNVMTDSLREQTVGNGVYIDGLLAKDGDVLPGYATINTTRDIGWDERTAAVTSISANITLTLQGGAGYTGKLFEVVKLDATATDSVHVKTDDGVALSGINVINGRRVSLTVEGDYVRVVKTGTAAYIVLSSRIAGTTY